MDKEFQVGDLVWGKMKGYPPWPGKIAEPPEDQKSKKNCHYIFFFGSENYAWIPDECIEMHSDELLKQYKNRKVPLLQKAIQAIIEQSENISQSGASIETPETSKDKSSEADTSDVELLEESSPVEVLEESSPVEVLEESSPLSQKGSSPAKKNKQDDTSKPSTSGGVFFIPQSNRERAQYFDKFMDNIKDEEPVIESTFLSHSPAVIPSPDALNRPSPLTKAQYIERPKSPEFDFSQSEYLKERKIVPTKKRIGFLGLTKKSKGIIKNLFHSGHSVMIWDEKTKECKKFADKLKVKVASTAADLIKATDIIFSCLPDDEAVRKPVFECLLKEIEHSKKKKGYVEMTDIPPHISEMMATDIKMKGGLYLEAPLCGTLGDCSDGTLFITSAGDKELYDECESCLDAITKKHLYMSPEFGSAIKMNVVYNMFLGTTYAALAESMSVLETRGLGTTFVKVLKNSDLNSSGLVQKADAMANENFQTETSVKEMQQNFTLGLALGHEVSHSTSVFSMANEAYKKAEMMKYDEHDVSAVLQATKP